MTDRDVRDPSGDRAPEPAPQDDQAAQERSRHDGRSGHEARPETRAAAPEGDAPDENAPDEAAAKPGVLRRHPIWFGLGALALIAAGVAGFFYWLIAMHPYESTDDAFVDARSFTIAPRVGGYLVAVPVTDNQHVEAGQTLFQIYKRDYEIALEQAEAQIQAGEAAIKNVDAQVQAQNAQIDAAKAQIETAKAALDFAQADAARYRELAQRGAGTIQQSQSSTSTREQRQAALTSAQANEQAAEKQIGSLNAQKASAQAQLAQYKAQAAQAQLNLAYTTVTAAQAGRIVRLTGGVGELAQAGQSLSMFVPDEIWVTANYKETQITDMRPGQPVEVAIDAYPDRRITGRLASVQPGSGTAFSLLPAQNATGNYVKVTQRIPVKIVVDTWPADVAIGPGMSVVPTIKVRGEPAAFRGWVGP